MVYGVRVLGDTVLGSPGRSISPSSSIVSAERSYPLVVLL